MYLADDNFVCYNFKNTFVQNQMTYNVQLIPKLFNWVSLQMCENNLKM